MLLRHDIEEALEAVYQKWTAGKRQALHRPPSTGRSRHARRRLNRRLAASWEHEVRRRQQRAFDKLVADLCVKGFDRKAANRRAGCLIRLWLRDLVFASWAWAPTPDFFGDVAGLAGELGVHLPLNAPQLRLLGPGRRPQRLVMTPPQRIRQRVDERALWGFTPVYWPQCERRCSTRD